MITNVVSIFVPFSVETTILRLLTKAVSLFRHQHFATFSTYKHAVRRTSVGCNAVLSWLVMAYHVNVILQILFNTTSNVPADLPVDAAFSPSLLHHRSAYMQYLIMASARNISAIDGGAE